MIAIFVVYDSKGTAIWATNTGGATVAKSENTLIIAGSASAIGVALVGAGILYFRRRRRRSRLFSPRTIVPLTTTSNQKGSVLF
jgi:LPXTG-motif cell wall-anchored protein